MPPIHLTEEQRKDVEERIAKFKEGHDKLREELQVDLGYMPMCVPTGPSVFGLVVNADYIDLKYRAVSPSVLQEPPKA